MRNLVARFCKRCMHQTHHKHDHVRDVYVCNDCGNVHECKPGHHCRHPDEH